MRIWPLLVMLVGLWSPLCHCQSDFNFAEKDPIQLIEFLKNRNQGLFTVAAPVPRWVEQKHLPILVQMLDSEEPCMAVALAASSTIRASSTVGDEAAFLIDGYRSGHYPPALSSVSLSREERAAIRDWWLKDQRGQNQRQIDGVRAIDPGGGRKPRETHGQF